MTRSYASTLPTMFAIICSAFALNTPHECLAEKDRVKDRLEQYQQEAGSLPKRDRESTTAWRLRWAADLSRIAAKYPQSRFAASARITALGLANSAGDTDRALQISRGLLTLHKLPRWKARWHREIGSICLLRYRKSHQRSDRQAGLENFRKAVTEMHKLPSNVPRSIRNNYLKDEVLNLVCLGELQSDDPKEQAKSPATFSAARRLMQTNDLKPTGRLTGVDQEYLAQKEMLAAIHSHNTDDAIAALKVLSTSNGGQRWPASYYALMYAKHAFEGRPVAFQRWVGKWLQGAKRDSRTPFLKFALARSFFKSGKYAAALPLYKSLSTGTDAAVLLKADEAVLTQHRGGYYAEVTFNLLAMYQKLGRRKDAIRLLKILKTRYSKDPRLPAAEYAALSMPTIHDGSKTLRKSEVGIVRTVLIVGSVAATFIFLMALILFKRRSAK